MNLVNDSKNNQYNMTEAEFKVISQAYEQCKDDCEKMLDHPAFSVCENLISYDELKELMKHNEIC